MRLSLLAVYASSRGSSTQFLRLRLLKLNPAPRRPFDSSKGSDCRRRGFLALIRHQQLLPAKAGTKIGADGRGHTGKRGGFMLLTQLFAASLSWFFPTPIVHRD